MNAQNAAVRLTHEERQGVGAVFRRAAPRFTVALLSALMNRALLPGGYFPFGAAFIAAVPSEYATIAAVGGVIGCLTDGMSFLASLEGLRHVSALLAVGGIRWALGELHRINAAKFYPFFTALAGILLTGTVINGTTGSMLSYSTLFFLVEGIMAGLAAMMFVGASDALKLLEGGGRLGRNTSVSLLITLCAAALPLCRWELANISPGLILLHTVVLLVLPVKREIGGAVGGTAAGCITALSQYSLYQGTVCPVAALLAGYAARYGRIMSASVYLAVGLMGNLASGSLDYAFAVEVGAAGVLSCLIPPALPERVLNAAGFVREERHMSGTADNRGVVNRLKRSAAALKGVSSVVEKVSAGLDKRNCPEEEEIYRRAVEHVCGDCACRDTCCGECGEGEPERIRRLAFGLAGSDFDSGLDVSHALGVRCVREEQLLGELKRLYGYHLASCGAHRKLSQVRSVINEQLEGMALMLGELGSELGAADREDEYTAARLASSLRECGYEVMGVRCTDNRYSRLTVSLELRETDSTVLERSEIGGYVGECLGCEFLPPTIQNYDEIFEVELVQRQRYCVQFGAAQHCCNGGRFCGDAYEHFEDGDGCDYLLLSDGMGSGGRAAVDGAMACGLFSRLLRGGFGYESTVKIVNAALMLKSEEESLATVDSLRLNLCNGRATFCKAGAAQSYHVRDGMVNRIDLRSLPLGILRETDTAQYCFTAEEGDLIVMLSDGVPTDDSLWFEKLLGQYAGEEPSRFARFLLGRAVSRRPAGEDDDITVMVGLIEREEKN